MNDLLFEGEVSLKLWHAVSALLSLFYAVGIRISRRLSGPKGEQPSWCGRLLWPVLMLCALVSGVAKRVRHRSHLSDLGVNIRGSWLEDEAGHVYHVRIQSLWGHWATGLNVLRPAKAKNVYAALRVYAEAVRKRLVTLEMDGIFRLRGPVFGVSGLPYDEVYDHRLELRWGDWTFACGTEFPAIERRDDPGVRIFTHNIDITSIRSSGG